MELSRRQRKQIRTRNRRILREHRTKPVFLHSTKDFQFGKGASVWGFWPCPRCIAILYPYKGK